MFFYPKAEAKQSKFTKKIKQRRKEKHIYKKKEKEKNLQHDKKEQWGKMNIHKNNFSQLIMQGLTLKCPQGGPHLPGVAMG